jgi:aspartate racemase
LRHQHVQGGVDRPRDGLSASGVAQEHAQDAPTGSWPIRIERRLYVEIVEHLIACLPAEGCGLIAFDGDRPVKVYPGTNMLRSETRYKMPDHEVLHALEEMDQQGWWLGAIYHSHPHSQPTPSTTDLRDANWPDALMLIVSLRNEQPDARAWRIVDDAFQEVAIEVTSERARWLSDLRERVRLGGPRREPAQPAGRQVWRPVAPGQGQPHPLPTRGSEQMTLASQAATDSVDDPDRRAVIGILGGMGPLATADLYTKIIERTEAASDQEHIPVVMHADPRVPDRTAALLRGGEDPTPWLVRGAQALAAQGATFIVMPCNTAHAFLPRVQPDVERPFLSMIDAAADAVVRELPEARTVGLLATNGTIASEIYQRALRQRGLATLVPDDETQAERVMAAIAAVKAGQYGREPTALLAEAAEGLVARGAEALLAACTEIPIVLRARDVSVPLIDATAELAQAAVETARHLDEAARAGTPAWETTQFNVQPTNGSVARS